MNAVTYGSRVSFGTLGNTQGHRLRKQVSMPLLTEEQLEAEAEKRLTYRLTGVTTKLNPREVVAVERLAKKRGQQRGELIRQLILHELARDSAQQTAGAELTEIIGLRLMLTNLLKPLMTGQKITPEVFDGILAEVKKRKRSVAIEARQETEGA